MTLEWVRAGPSYFWSRDLSSANALRQARDARQATNLALPGTSPRPLKRSSAATAPWGLRCFLLSMPFAVGLLSPLAMPIASGGLLWVLSFFDRAPAETEAH